MALATVQVSCRRIASNSPGFIRDKVTTSGYNEGTKFRMPAKAAWLLEVPRILDELTGLEASVVDRAVFEKIFHVRRRRAIQLMHHFGGYQMGKTFIIERQALIDALAEVRDGAEFRGESHRKERLAKLLDELRQHRKAAAVSIAVNDDTFG